MLQRRKFLLGAAAGSLLAAPAVRAQQPRVVSLWHIWNRESDMVHVAIRRFNEANNGYRIEPRLVPYVQINPELIRAIAAGSPPDLVAINDPDVASYASQNQLLDLTDMIAQSRVIDIQKFYRGPQTSSQWRGKRYTVAREVNTLALYYNVDMFRAKGLDPDHPPTTWSQIAAAAATLTDPEHRVFGLGFCAHQSEQSTFQFLPWLWQAGSGIDKLDQPEAAEALAFWAELVRRGHVSQDVITQQQSDVMSSFLAGNYAMAVGGPWELPRFAAESHFQWRLTTLPVKDNKNIHASSLGGYHFAIPRGSHAVEGAFKAIEAMSDPTVFGDAWNQNGLMAPRTDIEVANPNWPQAYAIYREQVATAIQRGPHPQWPTLSRPLQIAIQEALTQTKPAADAMREAAQRVAPILARTPL
jgi:multiple sugar transport system substrate-binding protein